MIDYTKLSSRCVIPNIRNGRILSWTILCNSNSTDLSESDLMSRETNILKFIDLGCYLPLNLVEITCNFNNHIAIFKVMPDALMIGEHDSFIRINASMSMERKIAEMLGMSLLTSKIADFISAKLLL